MTVMHMTKNVGKPYEGKLHVRFDEGELKVKQRPAKESLLEISPLLYIQLIPCSWPVSSDEDSFSGEEQAAQPSAPANSHL